jgi:hypothetical protein
MKLWITGPLFFSIATISFCSYAMIPKSPQDQPSSSWIQRELQELKASEKMLRNEVQNLENQLKKKNAGIQIQAPATTAPPGSAHAPPPSVPLSPLQESPEHKEEQQALAGYVHEPQYQHKAEQAVHLGEEQGYFGVERFAHGITVTTSPLLGLKTAFDASDLLYQYPSMNEDLILLRQRGFFEEHLSYVGDTLDNRAIVVISGGIEGQIVFNRDFTGYSNGDINLSTAELDITPLVSSWANGFVALSFDSSSAATGNRVENSRIYLSRGFITFGNLEKVPLYISVGQMYVPFGRYSSAMLTTPLTKSIARIQDRVALLGLFRHGFYGEVYGYKGDRTSGTQFTFKQGGINAGYQTANVDFGGGYVTNIADSQGMQNNGINSVLVAFANATSIATVVLNQFGGFGETPTGNDLSHNVGAADGHLEFFYGPFSVIAEYITTTQQFDPSDLSFAGNPANVKAMHLETDFTWQIHNKPIVLGLIYGQTWESLALNVPKNSYAAVISTSIFKNTMFGIEYRHDINYGKTALDATTGSELPVPTANIGGTRNLITVQFGAYF